MSTSPNAPTDDKVLVRVLYYSSKTKPKGRHEWSFIVMPVPSDYLSTLPLSLPTVVGAEFEARKMEVMATVAQLLSNDGYYSGWLVALARSGSWNDGDAKKFFRELYSFKGMRLEGEDRYSGEVVIVRHGSAAPAAAPGSQTLVSPREAKEDPSVVSNPK